MAALAGESRNDGHEGLPEDFRSTHYLIANPDLWDVVSDKEASTHYVELGRTQSRPYRFPFEPNFYRELYLHDRPACTEKQAMEHWRASRGDNYGSLHEVLFLSGFSAPNWLGRFDSESYVSHNYLWNILGNGTQALVHFITTGIGQLFAISGDLEFEPSFIREILGDSVERTDVELYKMWVESLFSRNVPPSEAMMLRALGLRLPAMPAGFDWKRYFAERPYIEDSCPRSRWGALEHFINVGVLETRALPISYGAAEPLLRAAADRFAVMNDFSRGSFVYDRYLLCPSPTPQGLQHAADLAFREGRFARALHLYQRVRALERASFWTFLNGATCAKELSDFETAQAWICEGLGRYPRNARLEQLFLDVQHGLFDLAVTRHVSALRAKPNEPSSISEDIQNIHQSFRDYYGIGVTAPSARGPQPGTSRLNRNPLVISVLANCDLPQCTYYRVTQKLEQMLSVGARIRIFTLDEASQFLTAVSTSDIAIFYRLAASVVTLKCVAYCNANNIPTVYEIDDLVFDADNFPDDLPSYAGSLTPEQHFELQYGVALVRNLLGICDYGMASTECLRSEMAKCVKTGHVIVHRNVLSNEMFDAATQRDRSRRKGTGSDTVTIFYGSGTKAHARDFHDQVEPALLMLMKQYSSLKLVACGHIDVTRLLTAFSSRITHVEFIEDRQAYMKLLGTADINLAVLRANAFNDCKSEIKWLEAAALAIPSVVSDVAVYRDTLRHGHDVLISGPDPAMWYNALHMLINQPRLRKDIGKRALARALKFYDPTAAARQLATGLSEMVRGSANDPRWQSSETLRHRRQRILFVNIFFPPQAIGGATRIVAGEIMELCRSYADRFDLAVFCGNDEDAAPYELTTYDWNGVRVYSINTPRRDRMDWAPIDPAVKPAFEDVLTRFEPDLVHFHCIQRLTGAIVQVVKLRSIPYVITAHDAWWISDHQFLMDERNRLVLPWDRPAGGGATGPQDPVVSDERLRVLGSCLSGARAVLSVSDAFATIYRRAGIEGVRTVVNGLPELPPLERAPRADGKLRLGHFGGTAYIKGLFLLKRALSRGSYPDLELIVVDLAMTDGEVVHERWGATAVKIIGRVPQDRIGWLYGQIDVLIAPSIWPESFGLVVREAISYGLWVVTSDRGALPEAVIPEVNGFVVDLNDPAALPSLLSTLQADIARFSESPAAAPDIVTIEEHVREICSIYDDILATVPVAVS